MEESYEETQEPFSLHNSDSGNQPVVNTFNQLWCPLAAKGKVLVQKREFLGKKFFKENTFRSVNVEDLLLTIERTRCSVFDEPGLYSIDSHLLGTSFVNLVAKSLDISSVYPDRIMSLQNRMLVINTPENKHPHQFHSKNPCEGRVGTVEVILNHSFTGGELQMQCDGQIMNLHVGTYDWVAVHTDASCSINPVTSGARVSLIFDVIDVNNVGEPMLVVSSYYNTSKWDKQIYDGLRMSDDSCVSYLVNAAVQLRPDLVGQRHLIIDAQVLNPVALAAMATEVQQSGLLERLFYDKVLDFRPTHLAIHRTANCGENGNHVHDEREKGYLGTLVVPFGPYFTGGDVYFSRGGNNTSLSSLFSAWYVYAAGTTHHMDPVTYGTRVSLHYDIYDAGSTAPFHNPLPRNVASSNIAFANMLTRTTVCASLRDQVLDIVKAALIKADAVVIALQYLYSAGDLSGDTLMGGDCALYNILTTSPSNAHASARFDVSIVNVTLQYRYDAESRENVLGSSTYSMETSGSTGNTKFFVPIHLTSKHRAEGNADILGPYFVKGLCVRKRKC